MTLGMRIALALLAAAVIAGGLFSLRDSRAPEQSDGPIAGPLSVVLYTNPGATTPQIPLWAALGRDGLGGMFDVEMREWRSPGQLQSLLLAGKGDIWVGHVDGFARARARGAPVALLAVTGWRKMSVVSTDPAVTGVESFLDGRLAFAPVGSPAVTVMQALLGDRADRIEFEPHEPKQLALKMVRGDVTSALLPEPLVTVLLKKVDGLRVVCSLEDLYASLTGGRARMPLAGIAVHERLVRTEPERLAALLRAMTSAADRLTRTPEQAAAVLPDAFAEFVPHDIVLASLERDIILVERAADVKEEIVRYLRIVAPDLRAETGDGLTVDDAFFLGAGEANR